MAGWLVPVLHLLSSVEHVLKNGHRRLDSINLLQVNQVVRSQELHNVADGFFTTLAVHAPPVKLRLG